ncbi:MAG: DUF3307 domain-containing protein [Bacteroidia bacterium]
MDILMPLLLAHLLGDFVFQPTSWVQHKIENLHRSKYLYYHLGIHALLSLLAFQFQMRFLAALGIIIVSHGLIDWLKLKWHKKAPELLLFFGDQLAHISIIIAVAHWEAPKQIAFHPFELLTQYTPLLVALVLLTFGSSIVIQKLMAIWSFADEQKSDALPGAGRYIGMLERLFVFGFMLLQQWQAIGWLITAKSILRYSDLSRSKDRKLTEYVLIGTLLSIGLAMLITLSFQQFG